MDEIPWWQRPPWSWSRGERALAAWVAAWGYSSRDGDEYPFTPEADELVRLRDEAIRLMRADGFTPILWDGSVEPPRGWAVGE
jgi:hypothetical protein